MLGLGESFLNSTIPESKIKMHCNSENCPCNSRSRGPFDKSHQLLAWVDSYRLLFRKMINSLGLYRQPDGVYLYCNHDGGFFGMWWNSDVKLQTVVDYALAVEGAFSVYRDEMLYQFARDFQLCSERDFAKGLGELYSSY